MIDRSKIDPTWTLFLDRDGVINHDKVDGYILRTSEFKFNDGVLEAMPLLRKKFNTIIIVTNQRAVGRGLMTIDDLQDIHKLMMDQIVKVGGKVDRIYYCTDVDDKSPNRKPQTGMAMMAKKDFPKIDFSRSFIVGNTLSDMQFGRNAGMKTVFIPSTEPQIKTPHPLIDERCENLIFFAKSL